MRHTTKLKRVSCTEEMCIRDSYWRTTLDSGHIQDHAKPGVTVTQCWTPSISRKVIKTRGDMHNAFLNDSFKRAHKDYIKRQLIKTKKVYN